MLELWSENDIVNMVYSFINYSLGLRVLAVLSLLFGAGDLVVLCVELLGEALAAIDALVGPQLEMHLLDVLQQVGFLGERTLTAFPAALERPLLGVAPIVVKELGGVRH